ncbi:MAG: DUF1801 domain-containing protein [Actinomycetia bacterium]|nr:DUF1801 domain-containing protein [Actinomycetes bacterium]
MAENKTQRTDASVPDFLAAVQNPRRQADAYAVAELMREVTKEDPAMWGPAIVGYGETHLRYASGRELDWFKIGFSPRSQALTIYLMDGTEAHPGALARLGKHTTGRACLYIKNLADVDVAVLREIMTESVSQS